MVGPSSPRPAEASTDSDTTVRPGSSSSSPGAASHMPDHRHADTLLSRRGPHSPRRPTVAPSQSSSVMGEKSGGLKRPKPTSRSSSPESPRDTTPEPSAAPADSKTSSTPKRREKKARVTSPTPSPPPPSSRRKGKEPAADCPSSPSTNGSSDPASTGPLSPDPRNDDEPVLDDVLPEEPATHSRTHIPVAKQCEIDAVLARIAPVGPRIDPDTSIAVDERLHADEGFYDESTDSHYQVFVDATSKLRSKRRPYCRVRTPGSETHSLVQRSVVKKTIRMRTRAPKGNAAAPGSSSVASSSDSVGASSSAAGPSSSTP